MIAKHASGAPRPKSPLRATALFVAVMTAAPQAQVLQSAVASNTDSTAVAARGVQGGTSEVQLLVGRSAVLNIGHPITRVSLTSPEVADAMVTASEQLLVHGKAPGTISMFVWDRTGGIKRFEVVVQRDLSQLADQMRQLFPGEPITITGNGKDVVIAGTVSSKYVVEKAAEVAAGYVEKKEDVVNLLKQQEGVASTQVLLRVRFAEVSRTALTELGSSFFANGVDNGRWFGRTTTQQFPAPTFDADSGGLVFSDFLNLFLFDAKNQVGGVIRALKSRGLFQSLAEPNLIAENGKEASFLAGGEYPYPVVQGGGDRTAVTIVFKEFGIKLNFTPTIVGQDLVKLKVRPEVSTLDFSNAVVLEGFRVPALSTRRTETEVELQDGQTFAIAGLLNNTVTSQMQKIPGIGDIPILGLLFRSKAAQKQQTELVVMITPQILRRNSTGVSPRLPNMIEPFMPPASKTFPTPAPWNPEMPQAAATQPQAVPAAAKAPVDAPGAGSAEPRPRLSATAIQSAPAPIESQPTAFHEGPAAQHTVAATPAASAKPVTLTKEQKAALERARKEEKKRREEAERQAERDRKAAEKQAKLEAKRAEQERREAEKAAKEQAKLEAELQKRQAEAAKKQAEEDKKRAEELARAQQRLKEAQKDFDAVLKDQKQ